jgi:mannose-6-phosphate isomerase-like protein (cupin superfamily)
MKRTTFIQRLTAVVMFIATPVVAITKTLSSGRGKGFKVDAGKSRSGKNVSLFDGDTFFTKVSGKDTNGDLFVFESTRSNEGGPPLHYHFEQDEWWYVLQGEFIFKIGDETFTAKTGDSVFGPRMIPHAFAKVGKGEAKLLMLFQPAGKMEENFEAISEGVTSKMTAEERTAFRKKNGFEVVGPALTYLKQ